MTSDPGMRMGRAETTAAMTRRLRLHGRDVEGWFAGRGWQVDPPAVEGAHAFVDELAMPSLTMRRVWHTPMRLRAVAVTPPSPPKRADDEVVAVLQADGAASVGVAGSVPLTLGPYSSLFHLPRQSVSIEAPRETARIEIVSAARGIDPIELPHWQVADTPPPGPAWSSLVAAVNALLNADTAFDGRSLTLLRLSIETLVEALWAETTGAAADAEPAVTPGSGELFSRALRLIHDHAADRRFSISALASRLGVTRPHLTRVFRARKCSPRLILRRERVAIAQRLLAQDPSASLDEIAAASGFPSARALRESLRERM